MQTLATLIQSPQVEVLGITIVTGNQWRDEEVEKEGARGHPFHVVSLTSIGTKQC